MTDKTEKTAKIVPLKPAKAEKQAGKCPICAQAAQAAYKPFCSKRCADVDLGRWLGESYRVPTNEAPVSGPSEGDED